MPARSYRHRQLGAIHILQQQLGLDDATYRAVLERVTGKRSSARCDASERRAVLDELRRLAGDTGARVRNAVPVPEGTPPAVREDCKAMLAKVGAMLAEAGRPWAYAHGTARKMFHVQRVEWLTPEQLHRLVSALVYDQQRRTRKTGA